MLNGLLPTALQFRSLRQPPRLFARFTCGEKSVIGLVVTLSPLAAASCRASTVMSG